MILADVTPMEWPEATLTMVVVVSIVILAGWLSYLLFGKR